MTTGFMVGANYGWGAKYSRGDVIPEVKLKDGTVLHEFKVVGVGSTSIMARWTGGQGSIGLAQLPPEIQVALVPPATPKSAATPASGELPTEIKLTNGFVMHRAVVTDWDEEAVLVSYQGGISSVQLKNIVPEQRVIFEARKIEALAAQEKVAAEQALVTQAANQAAANAEQERKVRSIEQSMNPNARFLPAPSPDLEGIPEVKLTDGTVLHDFRVRAVGDNYIVALWTGGQGVILLTQLPDELRDKLAARGKGPVAIPETASAASSFELPPDLKLPKDIKLTNGFVMRRSVVTHWEENAVLVSYAGGIVTVQLKNIAPEQRMIFEARKSEALAAQARAAAAQAEADRATPTIEQASEGTVAEEKGEDAQLDKAVNKGLAEGYLVKGMTKEQVSHIVGRPKWNGNGYVYESRIHDMRGNLYPRSLRFNPNGILVAWFNQRENDMPGGENMPTPASPAPPPAPTFPRKPVAAPDWALREAAAVAGRPLPDSQLPTDIKLTNGFVMRRSVVTHWEENAVLVSYPGGIVPVQFRNIAPEQRVTFEARKTEALAAQAKREAAQAMLNRAASDAQQAQQTQAAQSQGNDAQLSDEINQGLSGRYLVRGMTKEQVTQVMGPPQQSKESNSRMFVYFGRGHDKYNRAANRYLEFNEMNLLVAWFDQDGNDAQNAVERTGQH